MTKKLRPCLMADYGCDRRALQHLFCPVHWYRIHVDDREALDDPMHKRCVTWGVDDRTGQLAYCPDPEKHRNVALAVVKALAEAEDARRREMADHEQLAADYRKLTDPFRNSYYEVTCACGIINNRKSALDNTCGACGQRFTEEALTTAKEVLCVAPDHCQQCNPSYTGASGLCENCVHPKPLEAEETVVSLGRCANCQHNYYEPTVYCGTCRHCVMCGICMEAPVPEYQHRCGQCNRGI